MITSYLGIIQQGLFFAFVVTLIMAIISKLAFPWVESRINNFHPVTQSSLFLFWSVLPIVSALAIVFFALLPSLLQIMGISSDHCLDHVDGHIHFCLIHRTAPIENWRVWLPGFLFLSLLVVSTLRMLVDIFQIRQLKRKLDEYRFCGSNQDIVTLDIKTPLALTCGLIKQKIFISRGLNERLTNEEKKMLIAHEKAHLGRHDSLKILIARSFSFSHFPLVRNKLLAQLSLSCEKACDMASTKVSKDPGKVAELLLKIERIYQQQSFVKSPLALGVLDYNANSLPQRISSLLGNNQYKSLNKILLLMGLIFICSLLFSHDILEHLMFLLADL